MGGSLYFILFIDDYTRFSWVYFIKQKSQAYEVFLKFKHLVEKQCGCTLKALRTDRGGELTPRDFMKFCEDEGMRRELTTPYTSEQNGVAEKRNRIVVEMARSMLKKKYAPNQL